jgi:Aldo/keto reductase family
MACDASLKRMQTDHIDLYHMHHINRSTPWDEVWQAMETLVQQGKVIYVGSGNFAGWHITRPTKRRIVTRPRNQTRCRRHDSIGCHLPRPRWNSTRGVRLVVAERLCAFTWGTESLQYATIRAHR